MEREKTTKRENIEKILRALVLSHGENYLDTPPGRDATTRSLVAHPLERMISGKRES